MKQSTYKSPKCGFLDLKPVKKKHDPKNTVVRNKRSNQMFCGTDRKTDVYFFKQFRFELCYVSR